MMNMIREWLFLLILSVPVICHAQELTVSNFDLLVDDKSALTSGVKDNNGNACALIRIELQGDIDRVEGNVVGKVSKEGTGWKVFLTDGTQMMRLVPSDHLPLMITFANYQVKSLKAGCTYLLKMKSIGNTVRQQSVGIVQDEEDEEYHGSNMESFQVKGVKFTMVRVAGGSFMMGATEEQEGLSEKNELPVHRVKLNTYWIGETEVTQALWKAVMGKSPATHKGDQLPAENFSYNDCLTFIEKLNTLTGREFRLPTEAEWEFAARGGRKSKGYVFSGSDNIEEVGWYNDLSRPGGYKWDTHPVAKKLPNELGLFDMSGNVEELCSDYFDSGVGYADDVQVNPQGPKSGKGYVARGGSAGSMYTNCRVSYRGIGWYGSNLLTNHRCYYGLRLVLSSSDK